MERVGGGGEGRTLGPRGKRGGRTFILQRVTKGNGGFKRQAEKPISGGCEESEACKRS